MYRTVAGKSEGSSICTWLLDLLCAGVMVGVSRACCSVECRDSVECPAEGCGSSLMSTGVWPTVE